MTGQVGNRGCRRFLRHLGEHVSAHATGATQEHAANCSACAQRLRLAGRMRSMLREKPPIPERLRQPGFFDAILVDTVEEMTAGPVGQAIRDLFVETPVASALPWPEQSAAGPKVAQHLGQPAGPPPSWLWHRVRDQVFTEIDERTSAARRVFARRATLLGVAAALVIGLLSWNLVRREGTPREPYIVFVSVTQMPLVQYPYPPAVLRGAR